MSYLSRESRGWERAWAVLGAAHGGDTEGLENGERWQYMGPAEGPAAEHCFRHRCHKGERVYFTVPVAVGDFEPATRTPLPIVGDDCAADKTIAAVRAAYGNIPGTTLIYEINRRMIAAMVEDVRGEARARIAAAAPRSIGDVRALKAPVDSMCTSSMM